MIEETGPESVQQFLEQMAFKRLKKILYESAGLNCDGYRDEYLKRRFEIRLRATGASTYGKYLLYLKKKPEEIKNLLNDLTVNYTMFFRDNDVYTYLGKNLLPKILTSTNVCIWSAGCATGEEPYSLAILIHKVLGQALVNRKVTIFASDIDKDALSKAAKGVYEKKQLSTLSDSLLNQFFTQEGDAFKVKDSLKQMICFEQLDLMNLPPHQNLDLVLCRNVMIYFSREGQQHVHMNFYNALKSGGYFITGKTEILTGEPSRKFVSVDFGARVYQKPYSSATPKVDAFPCFTQTLAGNKTLQRIS